MATEKHAGFVDDPFVNRCGDYAIPATVNTSFSCDTQSFYYEGTILFVENACADWCIGRDRKYGQVTIT